MGVHLYGGRWKVDCSCPILFGFMSVPMHSGAESTIFGNKSETSKWMDGFGWNFAAHGGWPMAGQSKKLVKFVFLVRFERFFYILKERPIKNILVCAI